MFTVMYTNKIIHIPVQTKSIRASTTNIHITLLTFDNYFSKEFFQIIIQGFEFSHDLLASDLRQIAVVNETDSIVYQKADIKLVSTEKFTKKQK